MAGQNNKAREQRKGHPRQGLIHLPSLSPLPPSSSGYPHLTGRETEALGFKTIPAQPHMSPEPTLGLLPMGQVQDVWFVSPPSSLQAPDPELISQPLLQRTLRRWGKVQLHLPFHSLRLHSWQTGPESDQDWAKVSQRGRGRGKPVPRRIPRPPTAPECRGAVSLRWGCWLLWGCSH